MRSQIHSGVLYIVATPIGNLGDITLRALDIFKKADVIFAEDTRIALKLLKQYDINPPEIISCYKENEKKRINLLIHCLDSMKITLFISDAGTPSINDPGSYLVKASYERGYQVVPIPGANALITALSASGTSSNKFQFQGFLPSQPLSCKKALLSFKKITTTIIFYESKHRIINTLKYIKEILPNRKLIIAKELTKKFEHFFRGYAIEILTAFKKDLSLIKGEFVIIISSIKSYELENKNFENLKTFELLARELPIKKAVDISVKLGLGKRNYLYSQALKLKGVKEITHASEDIS